MTPSVGVVVLGLVSSWGGVSVMRTTFGIVGITALVPVLVLDLVLISLSVIVSNRLTGIVLDRPPVCAFPLALVLIFPLTLVSPLLTMSILLLNSLLL